MGLSRECPWNSSGLRGRNEGKKEIVASLRSRRRALQRDTFFAFLPRLWLVFFRFRGFMAIDPSAGELNARAAQYFVWLIPRKKTNDALHFFIVREANVK